MEGLLPLESKRSKFEKEHSLRKIRNEKTEKVIKELRDVKKKFDTRSWNVATSYQTAAALLENGAEAVYIRGHNGLKDKQMQKIVKVIQSQEKDNDHNIKCVALSFKNQHLSDKSLKSLADTLRTNTFIRYLDIHRNKRLENFVKGTTLEEGRKGNGFLDLLDCLEHNTALTDVNIGSNELGVQAARKLSKVLERNQTLQGLNLNNSGFGLASIISISNGLQVNKSLIFLNLSENTLRDTECKHLANALEINHSLRILSLRANRITSNGAEDLANALKINNTLNRLCLQNNHIDEKGAKCFINLLILKNNRNMLEAATGNNKTLRELYRERAAKSDTSSLNKSLQMLELNGNRVQTSLLKEIDSLLRKKYRYVFIFSRDTIEWSSDAWNLVSTASGIDVVTSAIKLLNNPEIICFRKTLLTRNELGHTMIEHCLRNYVDNETIVLLRMFVDQNIGNFDVKLKDSTGRTYRETAVHHENINVRTWGKALDAFDGKYILEEGAPAHRSATCDVLFATNAHTNKKVALKITKERLQYDREREVREILGKGTAAYDKYILDYTYRSENGPPFYLEFERADRTLFDVINNERLAGIDLIKVRDITRQAAEAFKYIHGKEMIHGDFKPRNYLRIDYDTNVWKLIDFDAAMSFGEPVLGLKHSSAYSPPEMARYLYAQDADKGVTPPEAHASYDVWAFGVVLYELLSGTPLFLSNRTDDHLFSTGAKAELINWLGIDDDRLDIILANIDLKNSPEASVVMNAGKHLVKMCLRGDPLKRPGFEEILQHDFFTEKNLAFLDNSEPIQTHFFLSYLQRQAAGTVKDIYNITRGLGCLTWLDMEMNDLTLKGMRQGVENASAFILVVNHDTLFSPYVLLELMWALDFGKQILFVVEVDKREGLYPFVDTDFWHKWENTDTIKSLASNICGLGGIKFSGVLAKVVAGEKESRKSVDRNFIEKILRNNVQPVIEDCISESNAIPYRRRKYETLAMINHLMEKIGFVPPSRLVDKNIEEAHFFLQMLSITKIVVLIGPETPRNENISKIILNAVNPYLYLDDYSSQWLEIGPDDVIEDELLTSTIVVLGIVTPGFLEAHEMNLKKFLGKHGLNLPRVFIQDGIFSMPQTDQDQMFKGQFARLFSQTELMPFRPPGPRNYEHGAMAKELGHRLTQRGLVLERAIEAD